MMALRATDTMRALLRAGIAQHHPDAGDAERQRLLARASACSHGPAPKRRVSL